MRSGTSNAQRAGVLKHWRRVDELEDKTEWAHIAIHEANRKDDADEECKRCYTVTAHGHTSSTSAPLSTP